MAEVPPGEGLVRLRAAARAAAHAAHANGGIYVDDITDAVLAEVLSGADPFTLVQAVHDHRRAAEPGHDNVGCWCCCLTCAVSYHVVRDDKDDE